MNTLGSKGMVHLKNRRMIFWARGPSRTEVVIDLIRTLSTVVAFLDEFLKDSPVAYYNQKFR